MTLAENLETETQALLDADKELLSAVDYGDRLSEMQQRFDDAISAGRPTWPTTRSTRSASPP